MKDWKLEDLDEGLLEIFDKTVNVSKDGCLFFEDTHKKLGKKGELELQLFSLFYSWKYLQEQKLITMTVDNIKMFITAGFIKFEKSKDEIKIGEFVELYRERFTHHVEEFKTIINKSNENKFYFPSYFYEVVGDDEELKDYLESHSCVEETDYTIELTNKYIYLIDYMKTQLDKSFKHSKESYIKNDNYLILIKSQMETRIKTFLIDSLQQNKDLPDIMQGLMLRSDAATYSKNLKKSYPDLKASFNRLNENFDLSELEYDTIVDEITIRVLGEFIDLNEDNSEDEGSDLPF